MKEKSILGNPCFCGLLKRPVFFYKNSLGNASLFTIIFFTIFLPLNTPPLNQQNDGFPLEFLSKGPQIELRTLSQNCEKALQKLRTNRIMNKRVFLILFGLKGRGSSIGATAGREDPNQGGERQWRASENDGTMTLCP